MSKKTTEHWFQMDRYHAFERGDKYYVRYAYRGTNAFLTQECKTKQEQIDFIKEKLNGFRPFDGGE